MLSFESTKSVRFCDGLTRRDFLRAGALAAGSIGLSLTDLERARAAQPADDINCIVLFLVGGPSQLETWDPKPDAPDHVRGPFAAIQTSVPGIQISEHFPLMAQMTDRYAIVRSVHHDAAPIHETGHQLMQTGRLFRGGAAHPHFGAVLSHLQGQRPGGLPAFTVVGGPIGNTGVSVSHGQEAGYLGAAHEPVFFTVSDAGVDHHRHLVAAVDEAQRQAEAMQPGPADERALSRLLSERAKRAYDLGAESETLRDRYGRNTFGQSCLLARRLVEHGVRLATVNMFDTVFNATTWDCHADGGSLATTLDDYHATLCPMFDRAYTALLEDLGQRGMLDNTLVVATGEFGRTPQLNARGGRDHWPGVWSTLFAGANVRGGQVIGASDALAAEPRDRPVSPAEVAATIYHALGIDGKTRLQGPDHRPLPLADAAPVHELLG